MNKTISNAIRNATPAVVGGLTSWVVEVWAKLPVKDTLWLAPIVFTLYRTAVRELEDKYPKFGWLLGCLPAKISDVATPPANATVTASLAGTTTPPPVA